MKQLTLLVFLTLLCGCRKTDISNGDFSPPYSVHIRGSRRTLVLASDVRLAGAIQGWLRSNPTGWARSMTTYAPGVLVRNSRFSLNFVEGGAILNFQADPMKGKPIQVVKNCDITQLDFLREIKAQHENGAEQQAP